MRTVETTVNISVKHPISEEKLASLIKAGEMPKEFIAHIFALFTDVAVQDVLFFARKHDIPLPVLKGYYYEKVKEFYPNKELEDVLECG